MEYLAYTYTIKCPNGKSYYGFRYANKVSPEDDLWKVYFTSSKRIKELREQYSDDEFIATVDKTFESAEEAYEYETKFLTENHCEVLKSDDWLNEACFPVFADNTGKKHTEEARKKMSEATTSDAARRKMSEAMKGRVPWNKGKKHTEEAKKKMSEAHKGQVPWIKGKKHSEETKKKMKGQVPWNKGKKHTEEHKKKLSEALKGMKHSEETRKKISEAKKGKNNPMFGYKHSEETKKKMSEAQIGRKFSEETKKKMSEARQRHLQKTKVR